MTRGNQNRSGDSTDYPGASDGPVADGDSDANGAPSADSNPSRGSNSDIAVCLDGGREDSENPSGRAEDSGNAGGSTEDDASAGANLEDNGNDGAGGEAAGGGDEGQIFHRKVTPESDAANESLLRLIANLERCEVTDLPPLYEQVDHMVEHLFTEPPPADAQAELLFTYPGYRIELDQTGDVTLMKIGQKPPVVSEE